MLTMHLKKNDIYVTRSKIDKTLQPLHTMQPFDAKRTNECREHGLAYVEHSHVRINVEHFDCNVV